MDDGVLRENKVVRVDYLQQEDGLDKSAVPIKLQSIIRAVGSQHPYGITLGV